MTALENIETIGMPKNGTNFELAASWLDQQDVDIPDMAGRRLIGLNDDGRFVRLRDDDALLRLGTEGEEGIDLAFFGTDKLDEWRLSDKITGVSSVDELPTEGRFVLAGREERRRDIATALDRGDQLTVATTYPRQLERFAQQTGLNLALADIPDGSCEAYPALGWTDLAFDIAYSGDTLRGNELTVVQEGGAIAVSVCTAVELTPLAGNTEENIRRIGTVLLDRLQLPKEGSLSSELLTDDNALSKKLGEEFAEFLQAMLRSDVDPNELVNEAADLLYGMQLALTKNGLSALDVIREDIRRNSV